MLVVISDLHFEEEKSRNIKGNGQHESIEVPRNISFKAFSKIFMRLAEQADRDGAQEIDLVLAGDIFELHRTALWFQNNPQNVRPYVATDEVEQALEDKLVEILHAINSDGSEVAKVFAAIRQLAEGGVKYRAENGKMKEFKKVNVHYFPGNHDRHANSTPKIRSTIREFLGVPGGDEPFEHALPFEPERTLVRHGHEYDPLNFSQDFSKAEVFPRRLPDAAYNGAPIGDFVTVDIAARISHIFRNVHGDDKILADPLLRRVYERSLEFDDLRPMQALLNYLLYIPTSSFSPDKIWEQALQPVIIQLLEDLHDHPFLLYWLDQLDKKGVPDMVDAIQAILKLKPWNWLDLSLKQIQRVSNLALKKHQASAGPQAIAAREETIQNGEHLYIVGGHTHTPAVELIGQRPAGEQYYVDTGTWRRQIPSTPDYKGFGRIKSLTYVVIYGPDEDPSNPTIPGKVASLDYWSGVTERWIQ